MSSNLCLFYKPDDPCFKNGDRYNNGYSAYYIQRHYPDLYRNLRQNSPGTSFGDHDIIICKKHFNLYIERNPSVQCRRVSPAHGNYSFTFR